MKNSIIFLMSICLVASSCQKDRVTRIDGTVNGPADSTVTINDDVIAFNDLGGFTYTLRLNEPTSVVFHYRNTEILLYLIPSEKLHITFDGNDMVNTIRFGGEGAEINDFLVSLARQSLEVSPWFENNWYDLYRKEETDFIHVIDSLQNTFLVLFEDFQSRHPFSDSVFINGLIADTYFSFNRLILLYPSQHEQFTGVRVVLDKSTEEQLSGTEINDPGFIDLDHYEAYCREWIEYNLQKRLQNSSSSKNYYLKRMDELFGLLPEMFNHPEVRDFWLAGYLSGHIRSYGVSNGKDYIERFNAVCTTAKYKQQVDEAFKEEAEACMDHSVEIYKTVGGFHLEAHIFSPGTGTTGKKAPGIVLFHGGGWSEGNPSWAFSRARHFARKGMVAVAARYRLANRADITPIEGMEDARDIIRWMRLKSDSLGIIPDSIVAYGWSAGGHLAAGAAIFPGEPTEKPGPAPNALVLVSPALDMVNDGWFQYLLGSRADAGTLSPVEHVRKGLPSTIILQGRDDTVTPLAGARLFYERMIAAGNDCELWIYDGVGHIFTPNTMPDNGWPNPDPYIEQEAYEQADMFLEERGYIL